jgi:hypothetical protein
VVYDAYPTEQPGFFRRVGDFFRDLFATEQSLGPRPTPPRPTAPRYNLDLPPPGTGYGYGRLAGHEGVEATEKSMTIEEHNGTTPRKTKTALRRSSSTQVTVEEHQPATVTKTVTQTKTETTPKPRHTPDVPPEERPSSSSSKVVSNDTPKSTTTTPKVPANVPSGTRTSKTTRVKSPYPPYNELDVTGLSPGSLAMDPTTQKVFRVP